MGRLIYGPTVYELEDRVLAHLQLVVGMKLRRSEKFFVSWRNPDAEGSGRQSLWFDNGIHLSFEYDGTRIPAVNRDWVEAMASSAASNYGLQLTDENGRLLNTGRDDFTGTGATPIVSPDTAA
jgi:hypothetical protein